MYVAALYCLAFGLLLLCRGVLSCDPSVLQGSSPLPPFLGVPCTSKEHFALPGMRCSAGLWSRRNVSRLTLVCLGRVSTLTTLSIRLCLRLQHRPVEAATAVQRLQRAGFVITGTTNTSELCMWM